MSAGGTPSSADQALDVLRKSVTHGQQQAAVCVLARELDVLVERLAAAEQDIERLRETLGRMAEKKDRWQKQAQRAEARGSELERALERCLAGVRVIADHDPVQEWPFGARMNLVSVARAVLGSVPHHEQTISGAKAATVGPPSRVGAGEDEATQPQLAPESVPHHEGQG